MKDEKTRLEEMRNDAILRKISKEKSAPAEVARRLELCRQAEDNLLSLMLSGLTRGRIKRLADRLGHSPEEVVTSWLDEVETYTETTFDLKTHSTPCA